MNVCSSVLPGGVGGALPIGGVGGTGVAGAAVPGGALGGTGVAGGALPVGGVGGTGVAGGRCLVCMKIQELVFYHWWYYGYYLEKSLFCQFTQLG